MHPLPRVVVRSRPIIRRREVVTARRPVSNSLAPPAPETPGPAVTTASYLDYARLLTPEGGVFLTYKDIDTRWRWWAWRILAWTAATGFDGWIAFDQSPLTGIWLNGFCWLAVAILNGLIVWPPIAIQRHLEIKPDCLVLEGRDVFWRRFMEGGLPCLQPKKDEPGTFSFCGTYGTRLVEYGVLRRFDENDRQPETFAAHFQMAMEQLWTSVAA